MRLLVLALLLPGCAGPEYLIDDHVAVKLANLTQGERREYAVQAMRLPDWNPTFALAERLRGFEREPAGGSVRVRSKSRGLWKWATALLVISAPVIVSGSLLLSAAPGQDQQARADCAAPNAGWFCGLDHSMSAAAEYGVGGGLTFVGAALAITSLVMFMVEATQLPEEGPRGKRQRLTAPYWRPERPPDAQPPLSSPDEPN